MFGNGPFMLEAPRTDTEIVLVPNPDWDGTQYDEAFALPEQPYLDRLTFRVSTDPDTSYNSFEAGEGDNGPDPAGPGQRGDERLRQHHRRGHPRQLPLRREPARPRGRRRGEQGAPQGHLAGDRPGRDQRGRLRGQPHGLQRNHPPGHPRLGRPISATTACTTPRPPRSTSTPGQAEGNELTEPLRIQYNIGAGHENVVAIIIDNLAAIGIDAVEEGIDTETYFTQIAEGACQICRTGWFADYPTYDNFMYDLYHTDSLGGNNHGYSNPEFDELVDEAKQTTDPERAGRAVPGGRDDPARRRRDHPAQLVPGRLRLQRGQDRRLHADQLRSHPV